MKWIDKKLENQPLSLKRHLLTPHHSYDNYKEKDELRMALLKEQGFICCYCMRRIQEATEGKMKIEHFKAFSIYNGKEGYSDLTIDFKNLLGSCKGGENSREHLKHCDKSKQNDEILLNPTDKNMMQKIRFSSNGTVFISEESDLDKTLNNDLNDSLNLNIQTLTEERRKIWSILDLQIKKEFGTKALTKGFINQKLKEVSTRVNGKFEPMCQIMVYYLEKKLRYAI
jgi:uncharacterized protein (TIGR02646 family)